MDLDLPGKLEAALMKPTKLVEQWQFAFSSHLPCCAGGCPMWQEMPCLGMGQPRVVCWATSTQPGGSWFGTTGLIADNGFI